MNFCLPCCAFADIEQAWKQGHRRGNRGIQEGDHGMEREFAGMILIATLIWVNLLIQEVKE